MTRITIVLLALLGLANIASADAIFIETPVVSATFEQTENGMSIVAPGYSSVMSPGDPAMPSVELFVILPPNVDPGTVSASMVQSEVSVLPGSFDIAPSPPAAASVDGDTVYDWGSSKSIADGRNTSVYTADRFFPAAHTAVAEVGSLRKWQIARVRYYPYCYNPVSGALRLAAGGSIRVSYSLKGSVTISGARLADQVLDDFAGRLAANFNQAQPWYRRTGAQAVDPLGGAPSAQTDYAIITTSAIVSGSSKLQSFVDHKTSRGYSVGVIIEDIWGGGVGDAAAENIRAYLKANYVSKGIRYVLLLGNPHPSTGTVPMKMLWPRRNQDTYREAPSDYYYADLTGNWDLDGDGYYGEQDHDFGPGGIDTFPEVIVGRIPFYGSFSDLDSILQKIISYESGALGGDWTGTVLLSMKPSDDHTPGYQLGEAIIRDVAVPAGLVSRRVYQETYNLDPPADYIPCNYTNVLAAWQQKAGFHFWWTHGSSTNAADVFTSSRTQYLDNNYPSFTFQCSCLNGSPEASDNLGYSLLKRGAIATNSATRVSWYYPGQTSYTNTDSNAGMTYRYAAKLIKDKLACGDAHFQMMTTVPKNIWMNHCVFNLYGDPTVAGIQRPGIEHTPLPDTDDPVTPYSVRAKVVSVVPLQQGSPVVLWNTDGSQVFNSVPMTPFGDNQYQAGITAQPYGTTVYYYIHARDAAGQSAYSPVNGASAPYSFLSAPDSQPPLIEHTPLADTADSGPYTVNAVVTDDRGISSVALFYRLNSGPEIQQQMSLTDGSNYLGVIPAVAAVGDVLSYRIVAVDASYNANESRHPSPSGYHSFTITSAVSVAILNSTVLPPYFFGGNSNAAVRVRDIFTSDPERRFVPALKYSLGPADLASADALVLPDNGVALADMQSVANWFVPGKVILAMDSAICYAAYSGFMWPDFSGAHGYGTLWDYSAGLNDQQIWLADHITRDYFVGQAIDSRSGNAQMFSNALPSDAVALAGKSADPDRCYAAYRDVPGRGRIVVLGPYIVPSANQYSIIRQAVILPSRSVGVAEAKLVSDGLPVRLEGKVVTYSLSQDAYVQEPDGACGIRVRWSGGLDLGSVVTIEGTMTTVNGERAIDAGSVVAHGVSYVVRPRCLVTGALGGAALGLQKPVMEYRLVQGENGRTRELLPANGLNNIGLLVKVFGRVTVVGSDYFYLDDGSGCDDGSGSLGVRVTCPGFQPPAAGDFVMVTAVSSSYFDRGNLFRALAIPAQEYIRVVTP